MGTITQWEGLGLVVVACLLGGAIGLEREQADKSAGLRTHLLVAASGAVVAVLGRLLFDDDGGISGDASRPLHAVVTGIGFLCAGAIITDRSHGRVQGLTTAASLFFTATIGLATGLGYLVIAIGTTILALFVLRVVPAVNKRLSRRADKQSSVKRQAAGTSTTDD